MPKMNMMSEKQKKEMERKMKEMEAEKLQAEEDERKKILQEKEEKKRLRDKMNRDELLKRIEELTETRELSQTQKKRLEQLDLDRRNEYAWKRYFQCDGSPNPSIEKEINTFMSLWKMDEQRLSMDEVITDSIQSLKTMHELQQLVQEKLDRATVETLSRATNYADNETSNLQKAWRNDWIVICIWGNLSKNPRIRKFTFSDVELTFDIPKYLTLSDCSFIISFMKFDNYSIESDSYTPKMFPKVQPLFTDTEISLIEDEATKATDTLNDASRSSTKEKGMENLGNELGPDVEEKVVDTGDEAELEPPLEDLIPTPEPEDWIKPYMCPDAIDLGDYHIVGGVVRFDLVVLPRQPKHGRGWTITSCVRPAVLTQFDYLEESVVDDGGLLVHRESVEQLETDKKNEDKPPVQVKFRLPPCLVIAEDPLIARWDPELKQWRTKGIEQEKFNEDQKIIAFKTSVFGTMGIFQNAHINMPYQYWELRPLPLYIEKPAFSESNSVYSEEVSSGAKPVNMVSSVISPPVYRSHTGQGTKPPANQPGELLKEQPSVETIDTLTKENLIQQLTMDDLSSMILGPVSSIGLTDEVYFKEVANKTDQCILTLIGGLTDLRLHILGDRIAVLPNPTTTVDMGSHSAETTTGADQGNAAGGPPPPTGPPGQATSQPSDVDMQADWVNPHQHELKHLVNRWFTFEELITVLQLSGVNFFPRDDSICRVECLDKNTLIEQRLYEQMALLSPSFAFSWSRWNSDSTDCNTVIINAVEHVDQEGAVDEETWRLYSVTRKKVHLLKMDEYADAFDPKTDDNFTFHADLYHMYMMDIGSDEGKARVRDIDLKYMKTVRRILQATRLLVFSY